MESILHQVFQWVLVSSVKAGILVALILVIKALVKDRLDTNWHYAIWALLFVQLVLPWSPSSSLSMYNLVPTSFVESIVTAELKPSPGTESPKPVTPTKSPTLDSTSNQNTPAVGSTLPTVPGSESPRTTPLVYPLWELAWLWPACYT